MIRMLGSLGNREVLTGEPGIQLEIAGFRVRHEFVWEPRRDALA
jgi:hypothetical protein